MSASWLISSPCSKLNHHLRCRNHRLILSPAFLFSGTGKQMVTASSSASSSSNRGAFTTLKERVTFEKEIKKSKFIAISGHIPDEGSAQSFLSEVPFSFLGSFGCIECVKIESFAFFFLILEIVILNLFMRIVITDLI